MKGKGVGQGKKMNDGLDWGTEPCSGHSGDSGAELKEPQVRTVGVKKCSKHPLRSSRVNFRFGILCRG